MRVLSIPAGGTFELIKEYEIHSFPNPRSYDFSGLVTFRKAGGLMESLYSVHKTIIIEADKDWREDIEFFEESIQSRIKGYIEERKRSFGFSKPNFMFWILKKEEDLLHEPCPVTNYNNHVYFSYEEICSGRKVVLPDSTKRVMDQWSYNEKLAYELKNLILDEPSNTEKESIIKSRIGQSLFKQGLKERRLKCAMCSITTESFLIASHIKPWKDCNDKERLDLDNGLLLCPNHDWLFDKGYVSFLDNGQIIISSDKVYEIRLNMHTKEDITIVLNDRQKKYMMWHRKNYFEN